MSLRRIRSVIPEPVKEPLRRARGAARGVAASAAGWYPQPHTDGVPSAVLERQRRDLAAARHFGAHDLERLQTLLRRADAVLPLAEAVACREHWPERFIALRHDLDHDIENAVRLARWEAEHGWRSTYFVLHTDWYWGDRGPKHPSRLVLDRIAAIASLGHEIGVHNNAITAALIHGGDPAAILDQVLTALRAAGFEIRGTASHGDPLCRRVGYYNFEIFEGCSNPDRLSGERVLTYRDTRRGRVRELPLRPRPMREFGLDYEAYGVGHTLYLSDAEGRWNVPPHDLFERFAREGGYLQVLTHPVHWALGDEVVRPIPDRVGASHARDGPGTRRPQPSSVPDPGPQ